MNTNRKQLTIGDCTLVRDGVANLLVKDDEEECRDQWHGLARARLGVPCRVRHGL